MSQSADDLEAFSNFEKAAHDRLASTYHDAFSAVTNLAIIPCSMQPAYAKERDCLTSRVGLEACADESDYLSCIPIRTIRLSQDHITACRRRLAGRV